MTFVRQMPIFWGGFLMLAVSRFAIGQETEDCPTCLPANHPARVNAGADDSFTDNLIHIVEMDPDDGRRLAAVQQLVNTPQFREEILSALESASKMDRSASVRRAAALGLPRYRVTSNIAKIPFQLGEDARPPRRSKNLFGNLRSRKSHPLEQVPLSAQMPKPQLTPTAIAQSRSALPHATITRPRAPSRGLISDFRKAINPVHGREPVRNLPTEPAEVPNFHFGDEPEPVDLASHDSSTDSPSQVAIYETNEEGQSNLEQESAADSPGGFAAADAPIPAVGVPGPEVPDVMENQESEVAEATVPDALPETSLEEMNEVDPPALANVSASESVQVDSTGEVDADVTIEADFADTMNIADPESAPREAEEGALPPPTPDVVSQNEAPIEMPTVEGFTDDSDHPERWENEEPAGETIPEPVIPEIQERAEFEDTPAVTAGPNEQTTPGEAEEPIPMDDIVVSAEFVQEEMTAANDADLASEDFGTPAFTEELAQNPVPAETDVDSFMDEEPISTPYPQQQPMPGVRYPRAPAPVSRPTLLSKFKASVPVDAKPYGVRRLVKDPHADLARFENAMVDSAPTRQQPFGAAATPAEGRSVSRVINKPTAVPKYVDNVSLAMRRAGRSIKSSQQVSTPTHPPATEPSFAGEDSKTQTPSAQHPAVPPATPVAESLTPTPFASADPIVTTAADTVREVSQAEANTLRNAVQLRTEIESKRPDLAAVQGPTTDTNKTSLAPIPAAAVSEAPQAIGGPLPPPVAIDLDAIRAAKADTVETKESAVPEPVEHQATAVQAPAVGKNAEPSVANSDDRSRVIPPSLEQTMVPSVDSPPILKPVVSEFKSSKKKLRLPSVAQTLLGKSDGPPILKSKRASAAKAPRAPAPVMAAAPAAPTAQPEAIPVANSEPSGSQSPAAPIPVTPTNDAVVPAKVETKPTVEESKPTAVFAPLPPVAPVASPVTIEDEPKEIAQESKGNESAKAQSEMPVPLSLPPPPSPAMQVAVAEHKTTTVGPTAKVEETVAKTESRNATDDKGTASEWKPAFAANETKTNATETVPASTAKAQKMVHPDAPAGKTWYGPPRVSPQAWAKKESTTWKPVASSSVAPATPVPAEKPAATDTALALATEKPTNEATTATPLAAAPKAEVATNVAMLPVPRLTPLTAAPKAEVKPKVAQTPNPLPAETISAKPSQAVATAKSTARTPVSELPPRWVRSRDVRPNDVVASNTRSQSQPPIVSFAKEAVPVGYQTESEGTRHGSKSSVVPAAGPTAVVVAAPGQRLLYVPLPNAGATMESDEQIAERLVYQCGQLIIEGNFDEAELLIYRIRDLSIDISRLTTSPRDLLLQINQARLASMAN